MSTKIFRNTSPESREFWESADKTAEVVRTWPAWRRAGILGVVGESSLLASPDTTSLQAAVSRLGNGWLP